MRPGAWYAQAIYDLTAAGVLYGYSDGTFQPTEPITRAEFVAVLARICGETATTDTTFTDVSDGWARPAISLAQEKGWVSGYSDGTFHPKDPVSRAEAVVMLNLFLGRTPDREAIDRGEGLRFFPDVEPERWYYYHVMEAATSHTAHWETADSEETWLDPDAGEYALSEGFYCFQGRLYVVKGGSFLRTEETGSLNGVSYTCLGSSGVCTADAKVLALHDGNLILLSDGKPMAAPGSYADGYYAVDDQLYAAVDGFLLHKACSGSLGCVSYVCSGASGVCTVSAELLALYDGTLAFLSGGRLTAMPGSYAEGFYIVAGQLYTVVNGSIVNRACSGKLGGVTYYCAGPTGVCTVSAEVLGLQNGALAFLSGGRPEGTPGSYENGFYLKAGNLYLVVNGWILREASTGSCGGVTYDCGGRNGVCTARAELLPLHDGTLLFLADGKPSGTPGSYADGFYVKAGQLYTVVNGFIVNRACSGKLGGVTYYCSGATGVCTAGAEVLGLQNGALAFLSGGRPEGTPGSYENGFYIKAGHLYTVVDGWVLRKAVNGTWNGVAYACAGANGVCTAQAEVLWLQNGNLAFLSGGKPMGMPGSYADGFYVKAGQLYVVADGQILRKVGSGTLDGISYVCTGETGVCTTADWRLLSLANVNLLAFSADLTEEAQQTGSETVSLAGLLKAAVKVYEAYFRVEYPLTDGTDAQYLERALYYGILDQSPDSTSRAATRRDVVRCLWRALRGRELEAVNQVEIIPDLAASDADYGYVLDLYKTGVMGGADELRSAALSGSVTRTELAGLLTRLERREARLRFTLPRKLVETTEYGRSGSGKYPLTACRIGRGKNVMLLTFAIHGWEDNYDRDGKELVYLADCVKGYLEENYELLENGDWTVYVLRCLNPDGLYLGTTCNGPGRCTTTRLSASGTLLTDKGIDMNRCFPTRYKQYTDPRNFNGTAPLQCVEAKALATFVEGIKGSGKNICVDTHGWYSQVITTSGKSGDLAQTFLKRFPNNSYTYMSGGYGYFTCWTGFSKGFDSCLLELPGVYSRDQFEASGSIGRFENAVKDLLTTYDGVSAIRGEDAFAWEMAPEIDN